MLNLTLTLADPFGWRDCWKAWLCRIAAPHRWATPPVLRFDRIETVKR